jgi:predicted metal-dependent peptidase
MKLNTNSVDFRITKAKAALILEQPFFATLLCRMPLLCDTSIPTMATDGKVIRWNPEWTASLTHDEIKFVLCHEVMHGAFQHMHRRGARDPKRWNAAGDYIINGHLIAEGVGTMPKGGLHNPDLVQAAGGTSEGVYNLLPESNGGSKGPSDQPSDQPGNQPSQTEGGGFPNGDGSEGRPLDDLHDAPGGDAEQSADEAEWKVAVAQAAQAAKMRGKLSARMARLVESALKPKVDWRNVLRDFVSQRARVDYSYATPKAWAMEQGIVLPSKSGEKLGRLVVAVDCSGSIGQKELDEFAAEVRGIAEDWGDALEGIEVIYWDAEVCGHDSFGPDDVIKLTPHGGGGTVFAPVPQYVDAKGIDPACCVVLTDLYVGNFGPAPAYPVLWVTTAATKAPWGEVVEMKPTRV